MSANQTILNNNLIQTAHKGSAQKIKELLEKGADPRALRSEALWQAINGENTACVKILARVSDIEHKHLFVAVDRNNWDVFSPLIEFVDLQAHANALNQSLVRAARFGQHTILAHLMEVADPTYQKSLAFRWAVMEDHQRCIDLLYPVSDVQHILAYFKNDIDQSSGSFNRIEKPYLALKERFETDQLRQKINDNITHSSLQSARKI